MDKIEALVRTLGRFGEALGNVKDFIGEIEAEVKKHTANLTKEIDNFKKELVTEDTISYDDHPTDERACDKILELRKEIEDLDKIKQVKKQSLLRLQKSKESASDLSNSINSSNTQKRENNFDESPLKAANQSTPKKPSPYICVNTADSNSNNSNSGSKRQWWNYESKDDETEYGPIDWQTEFAEREEYKLCLSVKEGWKKQNTSYEELEEYLKTWTGRAMKYTMLKKGRAKNGKNMFNVKFESPEDRKRLYDMRREIAEEGFLSVGETLALVERKERWRMLLMAERLKIEGREVEFENRRICVDGVWWKYYWMEGWRKL